MEYDVIVIKSPFFISISTHTLTWNTTRGNAHKLVARPDFNSHTHVEYDPI